MSERSARNPIHAPLFHIVLMVMPQEVQQAVDDEKEELVLQRPVALERLHMRGLDADSNIAQRWTREMRKLALLERKGEDVGWLVFSTICLV